MTIYSPSIKLTRNVAASLDYHVWRLLYLQGWYVSVENSPLVPTTDPTAPPNSFCVASAPLPWVWWDADTATMPSYDHIAVYGNPNSSNPQGVAQSPGNYVVNFKQGWLTFMGAAPASPNMDVSYFSFHVKEGYLDEATFLEADLPMLAVTAEGRDTKPFAIGFPNDINTYPVTVDVAAINKGQQQDMVDTLVIGMRNILLFDMTGASMFGPNGDINPNFNAAVQQSVTFSQLTHPSARILPRQRGGTDKEWFRALISLELKIVA